MPLGLRFCCLFAGVAADGFDRVNRDHRGREQFASTRDILGTLAAGEQAVVADAMEARGQYVHQEPADELAGRKRHHLVSRGTFDPVVLPSEGDALVIGCDQAAVGDGNAVGIAGEIAQDLLGASERVLAINHPVAVAQWAQIGGEGFAIGELGMLAEEL